jgi:hypothetical protein
LTTAKKRPALIISPDEYNRKRDVVIDFITSKLDSECRVGDYKIKEWEKSKAAQPQLKLVLSFYCLLFISFVLIQKKRTKEKIKAEKNLLKFSL